MKLNQMAMANAFGAVGAIFYIGCYLVAMIVPDLYKAVSASWLHMFDLSSIWKSAPSGFILGVVSFTIISWVSGWILAFAYNSFAKK